MNPTAILAACNLLDLSSYAEHSTGCPSWYRAHQIDHAATRDRRCDCGLDEQLAAVKVLAEAWREVLGQEPTGGVAVGDSRRWPVEMVTSTDPESGRDTANCIDIAWAKRLAADLLRAIAEVEAREQGGG